MLELNPSEIWLPVSRHDGYEVSNLGRVRSVDRLVGAKWGLLRRYRGKILALTPTRGGYLRVQLGKGYTVPVHKLVAEAFIGPCPRRKEVRHWDGDPTHNTPDNLLYGTGSDNAQDRIRHGRQADKRGELHHNAKLTAQEVRIIRDSSAPLAVLATIYATSEQQISKIRRRQRWKHL